MTENTTKTAGSGDSVLLRTSGRAAYVTLNRPAVINALDHAMALRLAAVVDACAADPGVETVVLAGAGERGLCAGGDIRAVHADATRGDGSKAAAFWADEYRLNVAIARYPKPYVALMDGIVMGGGVGVSAHGNVRIVTERSRIAMPETGIGFVPDVGGTYLLSRAPGELGTHLALTGAVIGAADALLCGLADHYIPADRLAAFSAALAEAPVEEVLPSFTAEPSEGVLAGQRAWIDECYGAANVEEILDRLERSGEQAAKQAAQTLLQKSPTSVTITLEAMRRARGLGALEPVIEQEYRVSCNALKLPDLAEGIRAQIIDKDRQPRWNPATFAEVSPAVVEGCFAATPYGRLFG